MSLYTCYIYTYHLVYLLSNFAEAKSLDQEAALLDITPYCYTVIIVSMSQYRRLVQLLSTDVERDAYSPSAWLQCPC